METNRGKERSIPQLMRLPLTEIFNTLPVAKHEART